ncbi:hypothetical protein ACLSZP_05260 [Avibacterium avium]|uniref:hypothetical protein n=1 Tax=Avibacterium avium TaxID=751 RepID=UPI003BF77F64
MKNKFIISTLCLLFSTMVNAGIRTIDSPPEELGTAPLKCGDYIYFGEKRSPYDVCMITGLLKEYERGRCINRDDYRLLNKRCSTKPNNIPQDLKLRNFSYYVEHSLAGDGFYTSED